MLHKEIIVQELGEKGLGLVAIAIIYAGEVVWEEQPTDTLEEFTQQELDELYKVDQEKAKLAYWDRGRGKYAIGVNDPSNHMNHSCDPNTWWSGEYSLIARRDIHPGEEVTYDYPTSDTEGINGKSEMVCLCGSTNCRKIIKPDDLLRYPELIERYKGHLPPSIDKWLEQKIGDELS